MDLVKDPHAEGSLTRSTTLKLKADKALVHFLVREIHHHAMDDFRNRLDRNDREQTSEGEPTIERAADRHRCGSKPISKAFARRTGCQATTGGMIGHEL